MTRLFLAVGFALATFVACGKSESGKIEEVGRDAWVSIDRLNRRTCPAASCGSVGVLFFREKATLYEERQGWARISRYYDASCQNGRSIYVDTGNASCDSENG